MKYILLLLILISCNNRENNRKEEPKVKKIKMKFCMHRCIENSFKMFHNEGSSWGTGSSSMNGLHQEKIFDRVEKYCEDYFKDETCCKVIQRVRSSDYIDITFGYNIGACNETK